MIKRIIVLSGPVSAGKSTLAKALASRYGLQVLATKALITELEGPDLERTALQKAGEELDRKTGGAWVGDALARYSAKLGDNAEVIVDSVRLVAQVDAIRAAFGARVVHVHITAPEDVLADRWKGRGGDVKEPGSYAELRKNPTESKVEQVADVADVVIDTHRSTPDDVVVRVASHLGLYGRSVERVVDVLIGGQYGSEGKGNVASYIATEYDVLVRVGGPNAGHKVYAEPEPHVFHHLPSGTRRNTRARIVLGAGAVLRLKGLLEEIAVSQLDAERLTIDPQAMIIEDEDVGAEGDLVKTIGSTGQGVGAATSRKILREIAEPPVRLARDIAELKPYLHPSLDVFEQAFARGHKIFLEGTQGTGLSLHHAAYPHVTSRDTTAGGCLAEAGIAASRVRKIIMVCRSYPIRVQSPLGKTSGPMNREISWEEVASRSGLDAQKLRQAEKTSTTKRDRRVGEFEWTSLRRAASLNGPTDIALTFVDYLDKANADARRFEQLVPDTIRFIEEVERVAGAPVSLVSTGFHHRCIIDRRAW